MRMSLTALIAFAVAVLAGSSRASIGASAPQQQPPATAPAATQPATQPMEARPGWVLPELRGPRVQRRIFESSAAKSLVSYFIYTPAIYDREPQRRFPVLYWLHGSGGGENGVGPLAARFDAAIRAGKTPPMLVVFPNGLADSMWCNSKDGSVPMETVVTTELLPHVDANFRTIAAREGRIVEGFSMGGHGAARLGFKRHDLFGAVSMLGAGPLQKEFDVNATPRADPRGARALMKSVWGDDQEYYKAQSPWALAEQHAEALQLGTRIRIVIGDADATLDKNRLFDAHLTELEIPHTFIVQPGVPHNAMAVLNALGDDGWAFYRSALGEQTTTAPATSPSAAPTTAPVATQP